MNALNIAGLVLLAVFMVGLFAVVNEASSDMGGVIPLMLVPSALMCVAYLYFLRAAQRAVGSVGAYASTRAAPPTLLDDTSRMAAWLRALQILAVLGTLLGIAVNLMLPGIAQEFGAGEAQADVLSAVVPGLISLVLSWLMYEAFRRFFVVVRDHAAGQGKSVLPAARSASGWMMFLYILQWFGVAILLLGIVILLLMTLVSGGALLPSIGSLEWLVGLVTTAVLVWAISLNVRLFGYASRFATEVGEALRL